MSEFTREQIIEAAKHCLSGAVCHECPLPKNCGHKKNEFIDCGRIKNEFIVSLAEEKEPAPAEADTSSKNNNLHNNDSTALKKSQERLKTKLELIALQTNVQLFEDIEEYQVSIPMLSHMIGEVHGIVSDILIDLEAGEQE